VLIAGASSAVPLVHERSHPDLPACRNLCAMPIAPAWLAQVNECRSGANIIDRPDRKGSSSDCQTSIARARSIDLVRFEPLPALLSPWSILSVFLKAWACYKAGTCAACSLLDLWRSLGSGRKSRIGTNPHGSPSVLRLHGAVGRPGRSEQPGSICWLNFIETETGGGRGQRLRKPQSTHTP